MKATIKKISLFMLSLAVVLTMAASTGMNSEAASKKPTKITLKATSKTVDIKGKVKVSVKSVKPSKASKSVTYKSSNKKIATVSSKGTVTGKKKGTVKITATSKKNKKVKSTIKITVKDLKASSVTMSKKTTAIASGKTTTLKATVKGSTGFYNQGVTWKSSNTKVATVTSKGVVKGIAAGQATITATEKGGSKKATCTVYVTEPVKVNKDAGTVTLKGILNASAFKKPTMHYLVTANLGASGGNPIFTGLNDRIDLANALDSLGATAWNTNSKTVLANGESIAAVKDKKGTNANYSKLNISVSWAGHDAVAMQDTIKNADKSAYTGTIVYANSGAVQKAIPSGCEICTSSCYAGICASEDVAMGGTTIGNSANLPKAGTVVTITIAVDRNKATYNYVSKEELKADIDGKQEYKLIDSRKAADYATSHIAGAVSADMDCVVNGTDEATATANIKKAIAGDSSSQKYAIICYSGNKYAKAATDILVKKGVKPSNITILTGGMKGWTETNYLVKSYKSTGGFDFVNGMESAKLEANLNAGNTPFVVFDLRDVNAYAAGHILQAFSTPLRDTTGADLSNEQSKANLQAAVTANPNKFYVVECYSGNKYANKAVNYLKEIGVSENRIIVLEGGAAGWTGFQTSSVKISAADLKADIDSTQSYKLIDARKAADYATSHIAGAVSADMDCVVNGTDEATATANIKKAIAGDSSSQKYAIICYSGNKYAKAATDILVKKGVKPSNITILTGGMKGWTETNYLVKSYKSTGGFDFVNGMESAKLEANLNAGNTPFVVFDLRDVNAYAAGHILQAFSTPLRDTTGADLSNEQSKANLQAAVTANPNKFYVVECYSGNKYANKAVNYLKEIGVSENRIIVLEGGAAGWTGFQTSSVKISAADLKADIDSTQSYKLIDARKAADYATSHIVGAVSADMNCVVNGTDEATALANAKAAITGDSADQKYAIICYSGNRYAQKATEMLIKNGVDRANIVTLSGGMKGWTEANYLVKSYTSTKGKFFKHGMTVAQLKANLDAGNTPFVVFDLRDAVAYNTSHIDGAISTPLRESIDGKVTDLSDDTSKANLDAAVKANPNKFYVVECYSGNNYAEKAVNYLKELGVSEDKVIVLEGGAAAWNAQ